ncbi:hypothetical protein SLS60_000684 [Paraconiothyrium brasiliense]|uniref:DUF1996 domain-containing protein n=1 Tax=Paraconiothyrium brasiliense TaxID=300254 RepID=A0ABR3S764_9PLEO
MSHMSYPETGTFESGGPCPTTHPVRTAQVMFEVLWDTKEFNELDTGYANHADYVFGWKDNSLQKVLDSPCYFYTNCSEYGHKLQSVDDMNKCGQKSAVNENIDGWLESLPGGF